MSIPPAPDYSTPYRLPYQLGIFLATNTIPDAWCVIDGPDCIFRKTEWVHGRHDIRSTLLDPLGNHRVAQTLVSADRITKDKGDHLINRLLLIDAMPNASVVFISAMPHVMIIGTQYDLIIRKAQAQGTRVDILEIPSLSLRADWYDGWIETLCALAAQVDVSRGRPRPERVALIGHLMDRNEEDHTANVRELRRLLEGLGLEVATIWLDGTNYASLAEVRDAGTLLATPMGRRAADILAARTGARVVPVPTPFGPSRTYRFLKAAAEATGTTARLGPLVEAELRAVVPKLEFVIPHAFTGRSLAFAGTPDLFGGMMQIAQEFGMELSLLASSGRTPIGMEDFTEEEFGPLPPVLLAPRAAALEDALAALPRPVDLVVGDSLFERFAHLDGPQVDLGFPQFFDHALFERPFLGFRGWLCLADRMAGAIHDQLGRVERHFPRMRRPPAPGPGLPDVRGLVLDDE